VFVALAAVDDASLNEGLDQASHRLQAARLVLEWSRRRLADLAHAAHQSTSAHPVHQLHLIHDDTEKQYMNSAFCEFACHLIV